MVVVSDASPLIALAGIGRLRLLEQLVGRVFIPPAVFREVVSEGAGRPGAEEVRTAMWIQMVASQSPKWTERVAKLRAAHRLGPGEAEAIELAAELNARWVVLDELLARQVAGDRGLRVISTIGMLLLLHDAGLVADVLADVERLVDGGFRVHRALLDGIRGRYRPTPGSSE